MSRILRSQPPLSFVRAYPLDDMTIRADGTGRTVEAYAAVFDTPATVSDFEGDGYIETIHPAAFDITIAERMHKFQCIYNHGCDLHGNPSDRFAMPLGKVLEVRADTRGVFTATQYGKSQLADEVLDLVRSGAIRSQSFSGRVIRSSPQRAPYRAGQQVARLEISLREFGPTPFPVYESAAVVGVRSVSLVADTIGAMSADERADLVRLLGDLLPAATGTDDETPEPVPADTCTPDLTIEIETELAKFRHLQESQ